MKTRGFSIMIVMILAALRMFSAVVQSHRLQCRNQQGLDNGRE